MPKGAGGRGQRKPARAAGAAGAALTAASGLCNTAAGEPGFHGARRHCLVRMPLHPSAHLSRWMEPGRSLAPTGASFTNYKINIFYQGFFQICCNPVDFGDHQKLPALAEGSTLCWICTFRGFSGVQEDNLEITSPLGCKNMAVTHLQNKCFLFPKISPPWPPHNLQDSLLQEQGRHYFLHQLPPPPPRLSPGRGGGWAGFGGAGVGRAVPRAALEGWRSRENVLLSTSI